MKTYPLQVLSTVAEKSRTLGPYVLLEVLLPGGTLFALALFLYRRPATLRRYARKLRNATRQALAHMRKTAAAAWPVSG